MINSEKKNFNENDTIPASIAAWLPVSNIVSAVEFYKSAFGATEAYRLEAPDGSLVVARLSVDGAAFWLGEESQANSNPVSAAVGTGAARMILTVTNPDAVFSQALEAGASEIFPVGEEHGWRLGRLVDPFGYHWEIGRPLNT
jgi:PhnB protein